jgi:miniconductance mechanosensitive channel
LTDEQKNRLRKIELLKDYIDQKEIELKSYNQSMKIDDSVLVNGRRMTNLGTFRKYIESYLASLPNVHKEMNMLVRQLQPNENGIPLEVIFFSKDQDWVNYENLQSDIFDHLLAVIPEFGLRVFQRPSGHDFVTKG